ncbi:DsbA family protein [Actibacterium sp. XHP0104]|uniref:DsbA family protein n=1 Tax=Actibacterium sp. XHP0104 TaxID=2984335 RepID=UPI0021E94AD5|nr:DsbA family protein [Actibacterium sp. XHP0104]MCV2880809.1 DsbA family protein [Actibacterium sp. XHP0104]
MTRFLLAGALAALTLAAPAGATDLASMSQSEREAFRAEVRAYLLDNPEVLMEAIAVLEERQAHQQVAADVALVATNSDEIYNDGYSWVGGNPDGDITLVEFMDYRCGYCRKAYDDVNTLIKTDGNIRFVVKEFPILGEESDLSSRFAIAAQQIAGDEAYEKAHDELITFRGKVSVKSLANLAEKLNLDADAVIARMTSPEVDQVIAANHALAQRLGISGTPTFVLEEQMLRGYVPLAAMQQIVAEVRAQ